MHNNSNRSSTPLTPIRIIALAAIATAACAQIDSLAAPVLTAPADNIELHSTPRDVWFEWAPVPNAETYTLELDCESCCLQGKFCSEVALDRSFLASGLQGTKYHFQWFGDNRGRWRVWASAGFIEGEKSAWRSLSFRTGGQSAPPSPPKIVAPVSNAVLPASPAEITFEWTPIAGARSYTLEVDPQGACAPLKYCSDVGVYHIIEGLTETHYTGVFPSQMWTRWRVWAVAGERSSARSPWTMFQRPSSPTGLIAAALPGNTSPSAPQRSVPPPAPVPSATFMTPEYSDAARAAGLEGTATVYFEIAPSGQTQNARILEGLGLGLDEKAVQLVRTWRFAPNAPPVQAAEISFRANGPAGWRVRSAHYTVLRESRNEPEASKPTLTAYVRPDAATCPANEYSIVQVSFEVGKKGEPEKIQVSGSGAATALRDAVRSWRFEPARLFGRERAARATFEIECGVARTAPSGVPGAPTTPPSILSKVEPEYSEEARQAHYSGSVSIQVTVDQDGFASNLRIPQPIGMGLDEKALQALKQWRFKPAQRDGKPVPFPATVEINFRLL